MVIVIVLKYFLFGNILKYFFIFNINITKRFKNKKNIILNKKIQNLKKHDLHTTDLKLMERRKYPESIPYNYV